MQRFYDLMRTGGPQPICSHRSRRSQSAPMTRNGGTNCGAVVTAYVTQIAAMGACTVQVTASPGYSQGDIGWFEDRAPFTLHDGESAPVRFTGVISLEKDSWRAVQTHMSIGTPSAERHPDLLT